MSDTAGFYSYTPDRSLVPTIADLAWRKIVSLERANPSESWSAQDRTELLVAILNVWRHP